MMRYLKFTGLLVLSMLMAGQAFSQEKKVKPISRAVKGEIITMENDTLFGVIKIDNAKDLYITSITFKEDGSSKKKLTAYDVKWFRQIVPYPDREEFGVDAVFFQSGPHPADSRKKVFLPVQQ